MSVVFMVRKIKSKKRKYYSQRTFGRGNKKHGRGKGEKGGKGKAGVKKQSWLKTIKTVGTKKPKGFGKRKRKAPTLNLKQISEMARSNRLKKEGEFYVVNMPGTKILANGTINFKLKITAKKFSKKAIERIKAAGGIIGGK